MRADRDIFIDQIRQFDTDTLLSLAVSLYDELSRLRMIQLENERISTEAHIQFSELNEKYAAIVRENEELKKLLEKEIEKNVLKTKSIFGRKTEGFPALLDALDNPGEELEDESTAEDTGPAKDRRARVIDLESHRADRPPGAGVQKRTPA